MQEIYFIQGFACFLYQ